MSAEISQYFKKAVVFGAGKMACALLGELLYESGFKTLFVIRNNEKIASLNQHKGYFVGVAGETHHWVRVRNCRGVSINEIEAVIEAVATADIVFTAVGIDNIPAISTLIAEGLWSRLDRSEKPLNVIASENLPGTGAYLRHQIIGAAPVQKSMLLDKYVGFSAALTHRIMTGGGLMDGVLHFTVDSPGDLIVDNRGLLEPIPHIAHALISDQFDALFLEKLSTINLAQAVAAYNGCLKGCTMVHEAALDTEISPIVYAAVREAVAAFQAEFPNLSATIARDAKEAITRITDPGLGDTAERIARGPLRKLGAQERLLGPTRLAVKHKLPHENLVKTIAAALTYNNKNDMQSKTLQFMINNEGLDKVLTEICGLLPHNPLAQEIKASWAILVQSQIKPRHEIDHTHLVEDIVHDTVSEFSGKMDDKELANISESIANEFKGVRISNFLPMLIKKKIHDWLLHRAFKNASGSL